MGYRPQETHYQIEFPDMPGLEVTMRSASVGEMIEAGSMPLTLNASRKDQLKIFELLEEKLVTWNVDHPDRPLRTVQVDEHTTRQTNMCKVCGMEPGMPLPSNMDGIMCLGLDFILKVMFGWMEGIMKVSVPKGPTSSNGNPTTQDLMKKLAEQANPLMSPTPSSS